MTFKDLKSGYPVYLLDRTALVYEQAKVMAVQQNYTPSSFGKMEVNVTIQTKDGKQNIYSVADTERTAYAGTLLIATEKESIVNELNMLKSNSEEALGKMDEHKRTIERCTSLLAVTMNMLRSDNNRFLEKYAKDTSEIKEMVSFMAIEYLQDPDSPHHTSKIWHYING